MCQDANSFEILETDCLFSDGHNAIHFSFKLLNTSRNAQFENRNYHNKPLL